MLELIVSMTIWGTLGLFVLWSGLPAIDIVFYRCLIGALIIGCWLVHSKQTIKFDRSAATIALGGAFLVLNWIFLFKSFQVSTITIGNISYYLQPVILIILGMFFYKEKVSLQKWTLILLALCGVLLTIDPSNLKSTYIMFGVFLALIAAFLYSFLTVLMKHVTLNFFSVIFIQLIVGVLMLLPFAHFHFLSFIAVSCLIAIGLIHTLVAYFLYYGAIKKTSFTQIAIVSYLDPIVAIGSDVLFFNRQLNAFQMLGIGLTFVALTCLIMASRNSISIAEDI